MIEATGYKRLEETHSLIRICLPYGLELFDVSRWTDAVLAEHGSMAADVVVGAECRRVEGSAVHDLYNAATENCIGYNLEDSFLVCRNELSVFYFDRFERFSFFAAREEMMRKIYPYNRIIALENFLLKQELDENDDAKNIFDFVNQIR
jgi:hypothetical protein